MLIQVFVALVLLALVFIYGVLALTGIDEPQGSTGYQPSCNNKTEAPGDE